MRYALALLVVLAAAWPAKAQVAVVSIIAEEDATQRDLVSALVAPAAAKWQMLTPPLTSSAWKRCKPDDTVCLREVAASAGASHLLVVAVSPLSARDRVVSAQLLGVDRDKPLFEDSSVQPGLQNRPAEVIALGERLAKIEGPPLVTPLPGEASTSQPRSLGIGPPVIVVGAAVAAASVLAFPLGLTGANPNDAVLRYGAVVGIAGGAIAFVGAGITLAEAL